MKKIIFLILLSVIFLSLISCGEIEYDENEVKAEAVRLIKTSALLDELFWGEGIEYVDDLNYADGAYRMASDLSLLKFGISTINDLEALTRATFSENYANSTLAGSLGTKNDGEFVYVLVRYYQKYADAEQKEPVCIMVNSNYKPLLNDEVSYLYDTVKVISSDKKRIYISVDALVTRGDKIQRKTLDVALVIEDGKYKIDTPTYTTYTAAEE